MTRRTFLKSLSVAGAGVAAGLSMLPKAQGDKIPVGVWRGMMSMDEFTARMNESHEKAFGSEFENHYFDIEGVHTIATHPYYFDSKHNYFYLIDGEWRRAEWA